MFKGGYSQIKLLIAYFELVQFVLKYSQEDVVFDKKHLFWGISDMMLLILENESDMFDQVVEQNERNAHYPDPILLRQSKRYMKLEKMYVSQNK